LKQILLDLYRLLRNAGIALLLNQILEVNAMILKRKMWFYLTFTDYFLLLLFGLWGYWHFGHSWPIVPASGDSEDDCGGADGV
jgi:hypothetical protein